MKTKDLFRIAIPLLALTSCQIFSGKAAPSYRDLVLADEPIVYLEMNEAEGTKAIDSSATASHAGTLKGGVRLGEASASSALGKSAVFDGKSGRIQIPSNGDFRSIGNGPWTIEFWYRTTRESRGDLVNYKGDEGERDLGVFSCLSERNQLSQYEAGDHRAGTNDATLGEWHHVALTKIDSGEIALFLDSFPRDVKKGEMSWDFSADLFLGSNHVAEDPDRITFPFEGQIDEFALYRKTLDPDRIAAHYETGRPANAPTAREIASFEAKKQEPALRALTALLVEPGARISNASASTYSPIPPFPVRPLPVNEEGESMLFDGTDFSNFRFEIGGKDREPSKTFRIENGAIVCTGKPAGYMATRRSFRNFTLKLDWRYARPANLTDDSQFGGNSGYLIWIVEPNALDIWPRSIEVQGMNRDCGKILPIPRSVRTGFEDYPAARKEALHPIGEWNALEIRAKDGTLEVFLNGQRVSRVNECELNEGLIGFQSEGAEIHWRNIRIREEN